MSDLLALEQPAWEMVVRGSAVYWSPVLVFRFVLRRDVGSMGVADLLFVVLVADASSNAMQGEYKTLGDGFILLATLTAWNYGMDWLSFRSAAVARFTEPPPEVLVRNGRINHRVLAREMLTRDELMGTLREQGVHRLGQVRIARLESDGSLSGHKVDDEGGEPPGQQGGAGGAPPR